MNQETTLSTNHVPKYLSLKKVAIIGIHAFIGWTLCTAAMGISMAITTVQNAMIIHAGAAPVIYTAVSLSYFKKFVH